MDHQAAPQFFLIFNHRFTAAQEATARDSLGVSRIVPLSADLQKLWSQIPPELDRLQAYLQPLQQWLAAQARPGDYALIQGDFGATFLMVRFALEQGLTPVYATTSRQVTEETHPDGTVTVTRNFRHQIFRRYGE